MRPGAPLLALLLASSLAACGQFTPSQQTGSGALPFILVSPAPNASPTPTAFRPPATGQPTPTSLYHARVATLEPSLPTATASSTAEPPLDPSPTVDLALLFPTAAAPPPPSDGAGVAPAPLPALTDGDTVNFLLIGSDRRP